MAHHRTPERFINFIDYKKQEDDPNLPYDQAASYTKDDVKLFFKSIFATHAFGGSLALPNSNKTAETAFDNWNCAKRNKSEFTVLKVDKHYLAWKRKFEVEVNY